MANSAEENFNSLSEAVARNAGNVISIPSAGLVRNFKSRFLGEDEKGLWLEVVRDALPLLQASAGKDHPVAVSLKGEKLQLSFATTVIRVDPQYRVNAQMSLPAALLARPANIKAVQRRASYRVHICQDSELTVRLWTIPEHAHLRDRPMPAQQLAVDVRDISTGGLGLRVSPKDPRFHQLAADQRLRVELKYQDIELLLEGRLRTAPRPADPERPTVTGVVFKKLESDVKGRQKLAALTRIVGELQREEVRRMRLGLAS